MTLLVHAQGLIRSQMALEHQRHHIPINRVHDVRASNQLGLLSPLSSLSGIAKPPMGLDGACAATAESPRADLSQTTQRRHAQLDNATSSHRQQAGQGLGVMPRPPPDVPETYRYCRGGSTPHCCQCVVIRQSMAMTATLDSHLLSYLSCAWGGWVSLSIEVHTKSQGNRCHPAQGRRAPNDTTRNKDNNDYNETTDRPQTDARLWARPRSRGHATPAASLYGK